MQACKMFFFAKCRRQLETHSIMFDDIQCDTKEVGKIPIGCTATPKRGSYFCESHTKDAQYVKFRVNGIQT
jgi:hypothetical protein